MLHRKQKESKQQPGTAGPGFILGCCLVSLRFLYSIHSVFVPGLGNRIGDAGVESFEAAECETDSDTVREDNGSGS